MPVARQPQALIDRDDLNADQLKGKQATEEHR
jgi:hypothetical protein